MAYEEIFREEVPENITPAYTGEARWRKTFDYNFVQGQVMKIGGSLDGNVKEFCKFTVPEIPEGKKQVVLVDIRFVLQDIEE